jgi:hypothetical protein
VENRKELLELGSVEPQSTGAACEVDGRGVGPVTHTDWMGLQLWIVVAYCSSTYI